VRACGKAGNADRNRGINTGEIFCRIFPENFAQIGAAIHCTGLGGGASLGPLPRPQRVLGGLTTCACRELNPAVLMMKSAEDRLSSELAEPLDGPMARRIFVQE
jgi:hypothetical protein